MNLVRAQQKLRDALNYRIQRGTMSQKLLSQKTGLGSSHISNFLNGKRKLSLDSMDRVLTALGLAVELLPISRAAEKT